MLIKAVQNPPFVLALTIVNGTRALKKGMSGDSQILVCVRNSDVNQTHPDVVSVPTQRIPAVLAEKILENSQSIGIEGDTILLEQEIISKNSANGHNELLYIIESLLCRKLGVSEYIERGQFSFEASLVGNLKGVANYPNLESTEQLQMLNVVVHLESGAELFPEHTTSYNLIKWVPVNGFLKMWHDGKDPTEIGLTAEQSSGVCVDGLCISSSADIVGAYLEGKITHQETVS